VKKVGVFACEGIEKVSVRTIKMNKEIDFITGELINSNF